MLRGLGRTALLWRWEFSKIKKVKRWLYVLRETWRSQPSFSHFENGCFLFFSPSPHSLILCTSPVSCPGVGARGQCFSTWSCEEFPGVHNSSLMPMEQCCSSLWGLSWRNASDQTCLSCTYTLLPGQRACTHTPTRIHIVLEDTQACHQTLLQPITFMSSTFFLCNML